MDGCWKCSTIYLFPWLDSANLFQIWMTFLLTRDWINDVTFVEQVFSNWIQNFKPSQTGYNLSVIDYSKYKTNKIYFNQLLFVFVGRIVWNCCSFQVLSFFFLVCFFIIIVLKTELCEDVILQLHNKLYFNHDHIFLLLSND